MGKLKDVQGLVTVGSGDQMSTALNGAKLIVDNRIITTSSGGVTLNFDNGCDITLKANESITVKDGNDCAVLWATVQPVGGAGAVVAGSSLVVPGLILGGGANAIIVGSNNNNSNSPN